MGLNISKITKLIGELCSDIACRVSFCGSGCMFEFDNKDGSPAHSVCTTQSGGSPKKGI